MNEFLLGVLGCSVVFGLPAVAVAVLLGMRRRLQKLEAQQGAALTRISELERRLHTEPQEPPPAAVAPPLARHATAPEAAPRRVDPEPAEERPEIEVPLGASRSSRPADAGTPPPETLRRAAASPPTGDTPADAAPPEPELPEGRPPEPAEQGTPPGSRRWQGFEEKLWTRLPVWLGAAAVALSAAFLVKLSFDRGWIQPPVRVSFGALTGIVLLVLGERLRRSSSYVAQGLTAAGIASLFISFYAAVELYGLVPTWLGFVLMALTTATAVALSLRQGHVVATIGLVGGFLTPALVSGSRQVTPVLLAYLLLLQVGLVTVTRQRRWAFLGALTLIAGLLWVFAFLEKPLSPGDAVWIGIFLLASMAAFIGSIASAGAGAWGRSTLSAGIGWGAAGGGLIAAGALTSAASFRTSEWLVVGLLALGCLVLARLQEDYHGLAWLAAAVVLVLSGAWLDGLPTPDADRALWTCSLLGALLAGGAYAAHHGSRAAGRWAALASAVAVLELLILAGNRDELGLSEMAWGAPALVLATLFVLAAAPVARRRSASPEAVRPLASLAVGASALVALGVTLELERAWLSVTWALLTLALVWLAGRLRLEALATCAGVAAVVVAVRLLLNPAVLSYPIGDTPVINWLLYGYGLPAIACGLAAALARRDGARRLAEGLQWLTLALIFALVSLEVRHYFAPAGLDSGRGSLTEAGAHVVAWLLLAWALLAAAGRWPLRPLRWGGRGLTALAGVAAAIGLGLVFNPLWSPQSVGETPIVNRILWCYGLPTALLAVLAHLMARRGDLWGPRLARVAALVGLFLFATLEVRQVFRGHRLDLGSMSTGENYAYSFTWIVLGSLLAVGGVVWSRKMLRYGSLAVLLPAIAKVFLVDTSNLEGLYRVFSLFGLGVSLFLLAYIYRRFVFPPTGREP